MYKEYGAIRQIIIITDGRSDIGANLEEEAARAKAMGITVNAIGIIERENKDIESFIGVEAISKAGGGICDCCNYQSLGKTLQAMTEKSANHTLKRIVSMQLEYIAGHDITKIESKYRDKLLEFIENYMDRIDLLYAIVLDTGKSMMDKQELVQNCIIDLMKALNNRKAISKIALISYAGDSSSTSNVACEFTTEISVMREGLKALKAGTGIFAGPIETAACLIMDNFLYSIKEDNLLKCRIN